MLLDYTLWIDIPAIQYSFVTPPNPVVVTQGEAARHRSTD